MADRVLLSKDDTTISLLEIATATASAAEAATVGFRIVVEQSYRGSGAGAGDDDVDTMEDVACRVPVDELIKETKVAAAVDRAFEKLVSKLDHPTLIQEVAPEARKAAAHVRAMCKEREIGVLAGVEFCLRLVFLESLEEESDTESDEEEVGSDLEFDEESWELGQSGGGDLLDEHGQVVTPNDEDTWFSSSSSRPYDGALGQFQSDGSSEWRSEHEEDALSDGEDDGGGQFSARPFDGALTREGRPSDGTLLLSGFEARADGPEQGDQHELTSRDVQRLVRLAFRGGDVVGDEAYQRALASGEPVSPRTRAVMLDQALQSAARWLPAPAPSGMAPARMRTGW